MSVDDLPHDCEDCGLSFATADGLSIHERRDHGKSTQVPEWVSHDG